MNSKEYALKIRKHAIEMTHLGKSSHVGAVLSIADLLAVLYNDILNIRIDDPTWEERDRFLLSKGHAGAGIYAALAERGFLKTEVLKTHYQNGSLLSGHVSHKGIPGVEFSTGSLGHGLSVATGIALGAKLDKKSYRVFTLLSDGECDEGSTWEAILFAGHHKLENLVAIIDYNKIQSLDFVKDTLDLEPFVDKWESFGWSVSSIDGHDHGEIKSVLNNLPLSENKPNCIIANTTKGKGVSFMENTVLWHYRTPQGEEYERAMKELEEHA
ncbi:MAG: transketolase [Candidatus Lokiarchaeota archaeon]|nr:transketolase [Candidatus Lokiarchaeota archaeon]